MKKLSPAIEDYLVTIYRIEEVFGEARTSLIAKELGIKPATVSKVIDNLIIKGLVTHVKYRDITLSEKGRKIASLIVRKHRILEVFLHDFLNFDPFRTHELAHHMEHLPDEIVEAIYIKMGRPKNCPHGNPVNPSDPVPEGIPISDALPGKYYRIVRIAGELNNAIKALQKLQTHIGDIIYSVRKSPKSITLRNPKSNVEVILNLDYSRSVMVEEVRSR